MFHITNGDSAATGLRSSGVSGEVIVWCDVLHEGPTPTGLSSEKWRGVRARFHCDCGWGTCEGCLNRLQQMDEELERCREHEEVVIWCEHDLYDQLILIRLLDWCSGQDLRGMRLSLLCVGEIQELPRFRGLGELTPGQLASLYGKQEPVTGEQLDFATQSWDAFCSSDPSTIEEFLRKDASALPYLKDALARHLEQFPSTRNGLSRTEQQILEALVDGSKTPVELFLHDNECEERVFMGDATFFLHVQRLSVGEYPMLSTESRRPFIVPSIPVAGPYPREFLEEKLTVTDAGREVLDGRDDHIHLNGIDRWYGGVHLVGKEARWRWNTEEKRLIPQRISSSASFRKFFDIRRRIASASGSSHN
ncbi:MAG: DUF1835 domain-containing protein [Armatimonadetes bacterium]|nr:DUF1835 domain-containing protein [Armatimonadota bacterium]